MLWMAGGRPNTNNKGQYSSWLESSPRVLPAIALHRIVQVVNYKGYEPKYGSGNVVGGF